MESSSEIASDFLDRRFGEVKVEDTLLSEILSESLFGEVIDIADLIPRLLSPSGDVGEAIVAADLSAAPTFAPTDGADILATARHVATMLTILYDDDALVAGVVL